MLPGSKQVAADLAWLRRRGLDAAIAAHVSAGKPTLAICGGLQMLGERLDDPHGVEGEAPGLGLLPYATEFQPAQALSPRAHTFAALSGFWAPLSGVTFDGLRDPITARLCRPQQRGAGSRLHAALADNCGWQQRQILALYPHGLFESSAVMRALFGAEARRRSTTC